MIIINITKYLLSLYIFYYKSQVFLFMDYMDQQILHLKIMQFQIKLTPKYLCVCFWIFVYVFIRFQYVTLSECDIFIF